MKTPQKSIDFYQSLIPIITMLLLILLAVVVWEVPIHLALFLEVIILVGLAFFWGYNWSQIEEMLFTNFQDVGNVLVILLLIGMLIGIWITAGIVPTMVYYGIRIIRPRYFLVLCFIITSLVSMAMGTAFGTASTIGLALISIARGLNLPLPLVAGAIISGSYVGDRMSPVSSIAIMTSYSAGSDLYDMIKEMIYSLLPVYLLSLVLYFIMGWYRFPREVSSGQVNALLSGLENNFAISPWLLLLPLLIIILALFRVPTLMNLSINLVLSLFIGFLVSGRAWSSLLESLYHGGQGTTGMELVDNILNRGGLTGLLELIALIIFAVLLGGMMEELGILRSILQKMMGLINNRGRLVTVTMLASAITAALGCNQLLAVFLPGRMMADHYDEIGVSRAVLGRALGDSGIIISPLIPWNVNALLMTGVLGVGTLTYLPYAFIPLLLPLTIILIENARGVIGAIRVAE